MLTGWVKPLRFQSPTARAIITVMKKHWPALRGMGRLFFAYSGDNPNGSVANIAGIINERGNVLGMMPHPERAVDPLLGGADGLKLFKSIVNQWRESHAVNA